MGSKLEKSEQNSFKWLLPPFCPSVVGITLPKQLLSKEHSLNELGHRQCRMSKCQVRTQLDDGQCKPRMGYPGGMKPTDYLALHLKFPKEGENKFLLLKSPCLSFLLGSVNNSLYILLYNDNFEKCGCMIGFFMYNWGISAVTVLFLLYKNYLVYFFSEPETHSHTFSSLDPPTFPNWPLQIKFMLWSHTYNAGAVNDTKRKQEWALAVKTSSLPGTVNISSCHHEAVMS
jgi:hypothetical protein